MTRKLKFLFTIIAVALLSSCSQSLEKKAQKLIENDMKTNYFEGGAEGAKVYEYKSLSFGTLDSVFTEVASDLVYMENVQKEEKFLDLAKKMQDKIKHKESMPHVYKRYKDIDGEYDEDLKNWIMWLDSAKYYMNKTEIIANNFKPILVGWKMAHTFSGVGVFGKRVATADFYFTKDVSEIYSSKSTLIEKFNSEKEEDVENTEQNESVASENVKKEPTFFEENLYESPKSKGEKGRISKNHPLVKFVTEKGDTYIRAKINNGSAEYLDEGMYMLDGFNISYGYEEETSLYARYPKDNCEFYDNHYYDKDGNTLLLE